MIKQKGMVLLEMSLAEPSARAAGISLLTAWRGRCYPLHAERRG